MSVPLYKPTIRRKDMDSVLTCLISDQIGPSLLSEELIHQVCALLNAAGGVALRDYGRAIELALDTLDLPSGAKVLISPLAPAVYFRALNMRNLEPLFCQVDQNSGVMDQDSVASLLESNPSAVIVFHGLGIANPMDSFENLEIPVIEDISQSLGAYWGRELWRSGSFRYGRPPYGHCRWRNPSFKP